MRWADANFEKPPKNGAYYTWHDRQGKQTMGYNDGWGPQPPRWWLKDDGCPHQACDGSFGGGGVEVLTK